MRRLRMLFIAAALMGALSACRTPFGPPTVPVANLYPTLHPGSVLDSSVPLRLPDGEVTALLTALGLLGPLRTHGMGPGEVPLVLRGLERHGYAELDARRSACSVHWVVLRGLAAGGETWLVVEAGMADPPAYASGCGIDVAMAPASTLLRADIYGRRSQVEIWRGTSGTSPVEVRRVLSPGRPPYWELEYRQRVPSTLPAGP